MLLGDVIESFRSMDVILPTLQKDSFRLSLNDGIKRVVEAELVAREGYKRGLQNRVKVRHDLEVWTDYLLSRGMEKRILSSTTVTDEDIFAYLAFPVPADAPPSEDEVKFRVHPVPPPLSESERFG